MVGVSSDHQKVLLTLNIQNLCQMFETRDQARLTSDQDHSINKVFASNYRRKITKH